MGGSRQGRRERSYPEDTGATEDAASGRPARSDQHRAHSERGSKPTRCWESSDPAYNAYHDDEWGRPVVDERGLYERLCLEGFQSGLSWLTIFRKRERFRVAFAGFDPEAVASFGPDDVERLLADAGIVRHRGKIEAAVANARAVLALRAAGTPLDVLVWSFRRDGDTSPRSPADWAASTPASAELSKLLRRAGFRFVGPTTVYATMQACGVVNDHLTGCVVRDEVEAERVAAATPSSRSAAGAEIPRRRT
jgi:DNA-3-methyladenine glycosylase I